MLQKQSVQIHITYFLRTVKKFNLGRLSVEFLHVVVAKVNTREVLSAHRTGELVSDVIMYLTVTFV